MRKLFLIALFPLAGCAHKVWSGGAGDFNMDRGQCQAQAFSVPGAPSWQIGAVFESCMHGKGWQLVNE